MLGLHLQKYPIPKWGQKGKTVKYVRAYLEETEEVGSDRLISSPTERRRRRRAREDRRETERERVKKLILGYSKKAAFQVRIFSVFFFFSLSSPCPTIKKKGKDTRTAVSPAYAVPVRVRHDTGTAGKLPCPCHMEEIRGPVKEFQQEAFYFGRNNDTFFSSSSYY